MSASICTTKNGALTAPTCTTDGAARKIANQSSTNTTAASLAISATKNIIFDLGVDYDQFTSLSVLVDPGVASTAAIITVFSCSDGATKDLPVQNLITGLSNNALPFDTSARYASGLFMPASRYVYVVVTNAAVSAFTAAAKVRVVAQ